MRAVNHGGYRKQDDDQSLIPVLMPPTWGRERHYGDREKQTDERQRYHGPAR
jgi:hypothetical protein